jgi:outer membrane biosynthesis protein TonB
VHVEINADGELVAFKFSQRSRFKTWNEELERAVKAASPFGPMPAALLGNRGIVDFTFRFYVSDKDS